MLIKQQIMENFKQMVDRTTENNIGKILKYLKGCGGISKEQNEMLLRKYIEKKNKGYEIEDIIERTILIMANDGLIWYIVSQHFGGDPDMYSVAKIGMIKAIDHFSFDRDCSFASFASKVMINEVLMCKRAEKRQI
ncbi:MAG: hypothetical protein IJA72_00625, partial [Clostridia bacterium]|nr:hypothetical protein [Clostridia bacterium]